MPPPPLTTPRPQPEACRTVGQVLALAKIDGVALDRLTELLTALDQHVADHGGTAKGAISIKVDFTLDRDGVQTRAKVTVSKPDAPAVRSHGFLTPDRALTSRDPLQPDLPLHDVALPARQIVDA